MPLKKDKTCQVTVKPESPDSGEHGGENSGELVINNNDIITAIRLIPGFSQKQITSLMIMISAVMDARFEQRLGNFNTNRQQSSPFPSIEVPQPHQEQQPSYISYEQPHIDSALRAEEIRYFDSEYQQEQRQQGLIINASKYVYYRDVYIFMNRLKDLAVTRNNVKSIMTTCFRGSALM